MNLKYTEKWTTGFSKDDAIIYDNKFKFRFEKNMKHLEQVNILKSLIKKNNKWLDFPVGSARLMTSIDCKEKYGFDFSKTFLSFAKQHGIKVEQHNLFDNELNGNFDIVTCMNALFAFSKEDQASIIKNLERLVDKEGILILDLININYKINSHETVDSIVPENNFFVENEIVSMLKKLGFKSIKMNAYDFYDKPKIINLLVKFKVYNFLNLLYFKLGLYPLFKFWASFFDKSKKIKYLVIARR